MYWYLIIAWGIPCIVAGGRPDEHQACPVYAYLC
jgi:hypothetical protein